MADVRIVLDPELAAKVREAAQKARLTMGQWIRMKVAEQFEGVGE